jgi:glycosyltransferase involved in cell wall biosynthesis
MNLLLLFDHRFFRAKNGVLFSDKSYHYSFFKDRYLKAFDHVSIMSRVAEVNCIENPTERTEGKGVTVIALPDWVGALGYLRNRRTIVQTAVREARRPSAVMMIGPGGIGSLAYNRLRQQGYPVALEVVGDPWDAFQPGAIKHPLRPILRRWLTNSLRKQCSQACAVSYVTSEFLQQRYPSSAFSVGVSDVVLPEENFVSQPRTFSGSTPRAVISVGVMNGYKGHDIMVDTVRLCKDMNFHFQLVMVGDGPLRSEVERRAEKQGVLDRIRFAGQLPAGSAIRSELDRADLFILPSLQEGMPRALLEAMARALPCVASCVGGVPEVLDSDFLVAPGDAQALAMKLQSVLSDPAKLSKMSARNLRRALDYEDSKLSSKRQEFYRQVRMIAERSASRQSPLLVSHSDLATSGN